MAYSDTYDVVVVGGGGAGLAAAVTAAERGASVVVVERQEQLGGTTAYSVGSLTAADTPLQRRKGIRDDPAELVEDMSAFDPALLDGDAPALRQLYAVESARTYDWLVAHGVVFSGPYPEPPHRVPRMHNVIPNSRSYIARLASAARRAGVEVMLRTEAVRLLLDGDRVSGLEISGSDGGRRQLEARRSVILASGDFSANATMRKEHLPEAAHGAIPINNGALGLGHQLAAEVGAELLQMDKLFGPQLRFPPPPKAGVIERLPLWRWLCWLEGLVVRNLPPAALRPVVKSLLVSHMSPRNVLFAEGAILIDNSGGRFAGEHAPADELSRRPERRGFIVLDESVAARFEHEPNYISTAPGIAFAYFSDYVQGPARPHHPRARRGHAGRRDRCERRQPDAGGGVVYASAAARRDGSGVQHAHRHRGRRRRRHRPASTAPRRLADRRAPCSGRSRSGRHAAEWATAITSGGR